MKLIPKNWNDFQQYKDRKPLWIKLHRDLLNDFSYSSVHIGTKATLPLLWLLACEYEDGIIDATIEEISFRIHIDIKTVEKAIKELVACKFFTISEGCTEVYETVPREEKRQRRDREETEKKAPLVYIHENDDSNRLFLEYLALRTKMKLSNSESVVTRLLNKLRKFEKRGHYLDDVILNAINSSWKDFYEPKDISQQQSFKQIDKEQSDREFEAISQHNIFDVIDEMEAVKNDSIQGVICE